MMRIDNGWVVYYTKRVAEARAVLSDFEEEYMSASFTPEKYMEVMRTYSQLLEEVKEVEISLENYKKIFQANLPCEENVNSLRE